MKFILIMCLLTFFIQADVVVLKNKGYETYWDLEKNRLIYTKHELTHFKPTYFARTPFIEDQRISPSPLPRALAGTGFDRGHMVPFADLLNDKQAAAETFLMTNIQPQKPELNRGAWVRLESKIRASCQKGDSFSIYTGPIYQSEQKPTAFFKAIFDHKQQTSQVYVMPNAAANLPLSDYLVEHKELEQHLLLPFNSNYKTAPHKKSHHWLVMANLILFFSLLIRKRH